MATLQSTLRMSLIDDVSSKARRIGSVLGQFERQQRSLIAPMRGLVGQVVAFGGAYLGITNGWSGTAGAAMEFESAFSDVRKVLNGSDEQLANIRQQIINMSKELPIAASGIAEIYAAAGQANIPIEEINKFSEMVAKVSTAWELPVAETGQALAEIRNQLQLSVKDVGLFADSLNYISNNSAATAPRLLDFTKRVASTGEMFGFTAQQTMAFGGAMIAGGAEAEVAATSFRNMGNALTAGGTAAKAKRDAFRALGLDAIKVSKDMQKNALKTTLQVIEKIQALPEYQRISMARALFGDEARALMPLINNTSELRRQLTLVGNEANYAGSSYQEYAIRAGTTANVLQILRNKVADLFRGIGDRMLPWLKEAALGVGDVIDSLGERATIFDQMSASVQGFLKGFGADGGIRQLINDLGDLLFGKADGSAAADKLGRLFEKFRQWGVYVRELSDAIRSNPIAQFFGEIAGYGFEIFKWTFGLGLLAGAVRGLASALFVLSGASTILGALKGIKTIAEIVGVGGGKVVAGAAGKAAAGTAAGAGTGLLGGLAGYLPGIAALGAAGTGGYEFFRDSKSGDTFYKQGKSLLPGPEDLVHWMAGAASQVGTGKYDGAAAAARNEQDRANLFGGIAERLKPPAVQDVRVTNNQPPNVSMPVSITITGVSDPKAAADQATSGIAEKVKAAVESSFTD